MPPQKLSKNAKTAITNDFENMHLDKKCFWNTRPPKRAPRQPRSLQEPLKSTTKLIGVFAQQNEMAPKEIQTLAPQNTPKELILGPNMDPKMFQDAEHWAHSKLDAGF